MLFDPPFSGDPRSYPNHRKRLMAVAQDAASVSGELSGAGGAESWRSGRRESGEEVRDTQPGDGASAKNEHQSKSRVAVFNLQDSTHPESTAGDRSSRAGEEARGTELPKDDLGATNRDTVQTTAGSAATKATASSAVTDATITTASSAAKTTASSAATKTTASSATTDSTKTTASSAATNTTKTTVSNAATDSTKTTASSAATKTTANSATTDNIKTTASSATTDTIKTTASSATTDTIKTTTSSAATKTTASSATTDTIKTTTSSATTDTIKTTTSSAATAATKTTPSSTTTKTTASSAATDAINTTASNATTDATKTTASGATTKTTASGATTKTTPSSATTKTTASSAATDSINTTARNKSVDAAKTTPSIPPAEPTKTALDKELEALLSLGPADPPPHDVLMIQSEQNGTMDIVKADHSQEDPTVTEGKGPPPPLSPATTWTSANLREFKHRMANEKHGLLTIRRGEVLTVRVPTHPDGKRLCWEFATDDYDIGFGIYFDWTLVTSTAVTLQVSESSDEEEEEDTESPWHSREGDVERGSVYRLRSRYGEIMQVYRRDSHREVQAGSHEYPGEGVYLLKLDNSYSLLRNKTLYFHVYYSS